MVPADLSGGGGAWGGTAAFLFEGGVACRASAAPAVRRPLVSGALPGSGGCGPRAPDPLCHRRCPEGLPAQPEGAGRLERDPPGRNLRNSGTGHDPAPTEPWSAGAKPEAYAGAP